jgi:hypothetical protein
MHLTDAIHTSTKARSFPRSSIHHQSSQKLINHILRDDIIGSVDVVRGDSDARVVGLVDQKLTRKIRLFVTNEIISDSADFVRSDSHVRAVDVVDQRMTKNPDTPDPSLP